MATVRLPRGRAAPSWEHIAAQVLDAAAASIVFSDISTAYRMFRITLYIIKDGTGGLAELRLNSDAGANYDRQYMTANGVSIGGNRNLGLDSHRIDSGIGANNHSLAEILIAKQVATEMALIFSRSNYGNGGVDPYIDLQVSQWTNVADLINRIDIIASAGNFDVGTRAVLEGIQLAA